MTRILPGGALAAAELYLSCADLRGVALLDRLAAIEAQGVDISRVRADGSRGFSLGDVAWLHGVTRQAVSAALSDPGRFGGRPAHTRKARVYGSPTSQIGLRFPPRRGRPGRYVAIRVTDEERAAWARAAGEQTIQAWLLGLPGVTAKLGAAGVREIANREAGLATLPISA